MDKDGRIAYPSGRGLPKLKLYPEVHPIVGSIWDDIFAVPSPKERLNYSGQQSIALLERVIQLGSNPGDVILDPFCGIGTTLVAAQSHSRRWIGCDILPEAFSRSVKRITDTFGLHAGVDFQAGDETTLSKHDVISRSYIRVATSPQEINPLLAITAMLAQGEGETIEFKSSACWNELKKVKDPALVENIIETVAGFMNSKRGGVLLIGVDDAGKVIGLTEDYKAANTQKQNRDGYQLFLQDTLNEKLGTDCISFCEVSFHQIEGQDISQIKVFPASKPIFHKHEFFVRFGNQTRKLKTQDAIEYCKQRWSGAV